MAYTSSGFTDTQDNQKSFNEKYIDNDPGPYIGTVKVTVDPLKITLTSIVIEFIKVLSLGV